MKQFLLHISLRFGWNMGAGHHERSHMLNSHRVSDEWNPKSLVRIGVLDKMLDAIAGVEP